MSNSGDSGGVSEHATYLHQTVKVLRGREASKVAELRNLGWELTSERRGTLRTELVFRKERPTPPGLRVWKTVASGYAVFRGLAPATQRRILVGAAGTVALIVLAVVTASLLTGDKDPVPASAPPQPSAAVPSPSEEQSQEASPAPTTATPTPTPTPTPTSTPTPRAPDVVTAANTEAFAKILGGEDCSGANGRFAKDYAGETIEFDGSVVDVMPHGSYKTRFDYLLGPGNDGPNTTVGPLFKYEDVNYGDFHLTGRSTPDSIDVGGAFRFSARVDRYAPDTCLFFLDPVKTRAR